jgi:hypothetical protein
MGDHDGLESVITIGWNAHATCGTIRLKFLKLGALVRISVRRIKIAMASACPAADDWRHAARRLADAAKARAAPI